MSQHPITPRVAFYLTLPPLLWAGNAVVGRALVGTVPPMALSAMRWAIALVLLLPFATRLWRRPQDIRERWPYLALIGVLGVGTYNSLQYLALQTSTPINVTLILSSMPLWMLLFGILFYREHPTRPQIVGAVLSLAGVALVISRGDLKVLLDLHLLPGDLLMLVAIALWAWYSWLLARPPAHMRGEARPDWGWAELLVVQMIFGTAWAAGAAGVEAVVSPAQIHWSPMVVLALAYVAIGPSLLAYRFWGEGVSTVGPAIAAFFSNLTPVFAALMSALWLGEAPRWYHVAAFVLIGAGIVVNSRRSSV
ncbi:DMT family transporter [Piscinibacter gummiphilus]|uniref:DMT family transporter n=1 Tax=Piscinibacter gummiphilus TaxID=946333 RepID=A0ABZ0CYF6_9BURK|nr:DMT family transporter [Piscinibacter gummiphilus]WOB09969.1 DMT family transporter [Piscinibacter gummiphilus]